MFASKALRHAPPWLAPEKRDERYCVFGGARRRIAAARGGLSHRAESGARKRDELRAEIDQLGQGIGGGRAQGLQSTIERVLAPLVKRERLSYDLAHFGNQDGRRADRAPLLDRVAAIGKFKTVLLSNEEGLPLAANADAVDLEETAAIAGRLGLSAAQTAPHGRLPLAIMLRDSAEATTLCRLFTAQGQALVLTAVSSDSRLNAAVLAPRCVAH